MWSQTGIPESLKLCIASNASVTMSWWCVTQCHDSPHSLRPVRIRSLPRWWASWPGWCCSTSPGSSLYSCSGSPCSASPWYLLLQQKPANNDCITLWRWGLVCTFSLPVTTIAPILGSLSISLRAVINSSIRPAQRALRALGRLRVTSPTRPSVPEMKGFKNTQYWLTDA